MSEADLQRDLRSAFGTFATGVTVVTTLDATETPRGFTANSFASVSLDPPLVSVCIARKAASYEAFATARSFAVNVLADGQKHVSAAFGSRSGTKFDGIGWRRGETGSPLIDGAVAHFDCVAHDQVEAGDHLILIGRVVGYDHTAANPLGYCRGAYVSFALASEAVAAASAPGRTRIGAIVEYEGSLYLPLVEGQPLPPTASRLGHSGDPDSLVGRLARDGLTAEFPFVFAVFEETGSGEQNVYYRGQAKSVSDQARRHLVPLGALDPSLIEGRAVRTMMERYLRERREDAFGVYVGDTEAGAVSRLANA
ncbi:flavin reductase family protein [Lutibaculum baratangense]|uniref:Nitrilotriacetate monooxygenase component B n=1 Tax=Lutibaculum baratangense AMV1 TaxID=631454 RepID=V4RC50_9HYPH|nr:flavin reductase family protein [Lutibaculum baratangense]ESR23746.1 Nitrilotriacetate monooxygenase component B [Lutibaculum baratangense AMV1]